MSFTISIDRTASGEPDDPHGVEIATDQHVFTRLLRGDSNAVETRLRARPAQLAFWLIDNWWRLRWEGLQSQGITSDWRLAHDLSGIGGGTIWPRLFTWGEGERIGFFARKDASGVMGPVRFLESGLSFIPADEWEIGVDQFLQEAQDEQHGFGSDRAALRAQLSALREERGDQQITAWRRMEARLGFDVDQAPDFLMQSLIDITTTFDAMGVEEAIQAAPGTAAAEVLSKAVEAARASRLVCQFDAARSAAGIIQWNGRTPIWEPAEHAAEKVRRAWGRANGPLRNKNLAEILGISSAALGSTKSAPAEQLPYGLRLNTKKGDDSQIVALKSRWSRDRRFELSRALGDTIWATASSLGPLAQTKTDRQRFQRAFAQSLLCPFDDLKDFVEANGSNGESRMEAAQYYHVNIKVIELTLVKKRVLPAQLFEDLVEAA